jgi:hypothetical protein
MEKTNSPDYVLRLLSSSLKYLYLHNKSPMFVTHGSCAFRVCSNGIELVSRWSLVLYYVNQGFIHDQSTIIDLQFRLSWHWSKSHGP